MGASASTTTEPVPAATEGAEAAPRSLWRMNIERPNRVTWAADSNLRTAEVAYVDLLYRFFARHPDGWQDPLTIWFRAVHQ